MLMDTPRFIFDFDSTFVGVESLDLLAEIVFADDTARAEKVAALVTITAQGMDGVIDYRESLQRRMEVLRPTRAHLNELVVRLRSHVTRSFASNTAFFTTRASHIYIISGGFHEYIDPILADFGLPSNHIFANTLQFAADGAYVSYDHTNPLAAGSEGKVEVVKSLKLPPSHTVIVGDGMTDYRVREAKLTHKFYAYAEHVARPAVLAHADLVVRSLDEILSDLDLPRAHRYPKSKINVLLLENVHANALALFAGEGYRVQSLKKSLSEEELCEKIKDVQILGIRSKTQVSSRVLTHAKHLHAIGTFCIGTNQVDLRAASSQGVAVFNAPFSNTRSVVELVLAEIICLMRRLTEKSQMMHEGRWDKSADGAREVRGKILGIVGYGNIGTQLSVLAESLGMRVMYYDIAQKLSLGNARKSLTLDELLQTADIVTLHVDGRQSNRHLIGQRELALMKKGGMLINASRGHIVDLDALKVALESGALSGAAVDVFPEEPLENGPYTTSLQGLANVILTPHIAGSTLEAQSQIGSFVAERLIEYLNTGSTSLSVNMPQIQLAPQGQVHRVIHIHANVPGVLASLNEVFGSMGVNIEAQYLKTSEQVGYVITDVNRVVDDALIIRLRAIPGTIRVRLLY